MPAKSNYEIAESDLHLVTVIARSIQRRIRQDLYDDLVSAGYVGLVQASKHFQTDKGYKAKTFLGHRIRGAMRDYLKSLDPNSRRTKEKVKHGVAAAVLVRVDSLSRSLAEHVADPRSTVSFDLRIDVGIALSNVSKVSASILYKYYFEGCSITEIAASMRASHRQVTWLCSQALMQARRSLQVLGKGAPPVVKRPA